MTPYTWLFRRLLYPAFNKAVGRDIFGVLAQREKTQFLPTSELQQLQLLKLREVVANAALRVPYYREQFKSIGFDPSKPFDLKHFTNLDFTVDKETVRARTTDFIAEGCSHGILTWHRTGGSTGTPLIFATDQATNASSAASFVRSLRWWGTDTGARHVMFWGSPRFIVRTPLDRMRKHTLRLRHRMMNRRFYPNYDLNESNMAVIRSEIERYRPEYARGMASSLFLFSRHLQTNSLRLERGAPKVVYSACEQLYDWERQTISEAMNARVANTYGLSEFGEIAFEAPCGGFHTMDEDVLVELLPVENGEGREIVVTQLNNMHSPLIRYRTGDIAESLTTGCTCGRGLLCLNGIQGRAHDFIVTADRRHVHGQFFTHLLVYEKGIRKYQVVQEAIDRFRVLLECDLGFDQTSEDRVRTGARSYLGNGAEIAFERVDRIPLTPAGKHRWIVSKVAQRNPLLTARP